MTDARSDSIGLKSSEPATVSARTAVLLALFVMMLLVVQLRPIDDVDIFWQVRLGELMLETHGLVTQDSFTHTHAGEPVPTVGWLAQTLFAATHQIGSWPGVRLLHALMFAGAFVIAALIAARNKVSPFAVVCATLAGFLAALSNSSVRPQSFGLLGFAALLWVVTGDAKLRARLLLLPPILLIWQNAHPSLIIGGVAVGALAMGHAIGFMRRPRGTAFARGSLAFWMIVFVAVLLAQFATPMGWDIFAISARNVQIARDLLGVSEWMPPWHASVRSAVVPFWIMLALSAALMYRVRTRIHVGELALFLAMTLLSLTAARFVLFWAVAMVPLWARWIDLVRPAELFAWRAEGSVRRNSFVAACIGGLAIALLAPAVLRGSVLDRDLIPVEGIAKLEEHVPAGRIYNYREWGGPLILAGHPEWQVAIDGRLYLYDESDWREYRDIALGRVSLSELVSNHRPDAFFLHPDYHERLIELLRGSPAWYELHADTQCGVFVPAP